jgi:ParB-like nuclease domain
LLSSSDSSVVSKDPIDKIEIKDIKIGERFRSEIGDISELVESIKINGLLCPITVTKAAKQQGDQAIFNNNSCDGVGP